jgi:hypothetical protein
MGDAEELQVAEVLVHIGNRARMTDCKSKLVCCLKCRLCAFQPAHSTAAHPKQGFLISYTKVKTLVDQSLFLMIC